LATRPEEPVSDHATTAFPFGNEPLVAAARLCSLYAPVGIAANGTVIVGNGDGTLFAIASR